MYKFDNKEFLKGGSVYILILLFLTTYVLLLGVSQLLIQGGFHLFGVDLAEYIIHGESGISKGIAIVLLNFSLQAITMGGSVFFIIRKERKDFTFFNADQRVKTISIFVSAFFLIYFTMDMVQVLTVINLKIPLPDVLMKMQKSTDGTIAEMLGLMDHPLGVLLLIVTIAAVPALLEELMFRGVLQNLLHRSVINIHVAIFLTGIIFSAFHFQFQGFLPRMFMGIVLGYMYYWSRNIWLPIFGHFCFNAASLVGAYIAKSKGGSFEDIMTETSPITTGSVIMSGVFFLLMFFFYQRNCWNELNSKQES